MAEDNQSRFEKRRWLNRGCTALAVASVYFVLLRAAIWRLRLVDSRLMDAIDFHHSDGVTWYVLWFLLPVLAALALGFYRHPRWVVSVGRFFLPLLIIGTLIAATVNHSYWGYAFKRPATFEELKDAKNLISASEFSWPSMKWIALERDSVFGSTEIARKDPYYIVCQAGQLVTEDLSNRHGWKVGRVELTSDKYVPDGTLLAAVQRSIPGSNVVLTEVAEEYQERANRIRGQLIQFDTESDQRFCYVCLKSWEVENDHYPVYEFLLDGDGRLVRDHRYFYDFAGIEGLEYATVAPPFELLLLMSVTILWLLVSGVIRLVRFSHARKVASA